MHVLEYDKNGFPKLWIDKEDFLHGFSLWKRKNKNESILVKNIPNKYKQEYENLKNQIK